MVFLEAAELPERSGALILSLGPDEHLVAASGSVQVRFCPNTPGALTGMFSIEEGTQANGDENGGGTNLRLGGDSSRNGLILRVKLPRYRRRLGSRMRRTGNPRSRPACFKL
jgi:hypothetical protein